MMRGRSPSEPLSDHIQQNAEFHRTLVPDTPVIDLTGSPERKTYQLPAEMAKRDSVADAGGDVGVIRSQKRKATEALVERNETALTLHTSSAKRRTTGLSGRAAGVKQEEKTVDASDNMLGNDVGDDAGDECANLPADGPDASFGKYDTDEDVRWAAAILAGMATTSGSAMATVKASEEGGDFSADTAAFVAPTAVGCEHGSSVADNLDSKHPRMLCKDEEVEGIKQEEPGSADYPSDTRTKRLEVSHAGQLYERLSAAHESEETERARPLLSNGRRARGGGQMGDAQARRGFVRGWKSMMRRDAEAEKGVLADTNDEHRKGTAGSPIFIDED
ncbi:hypothetical protein C1H76_3774 [Elsinoe australis]|uniref:Uncharacterized protein n=1 Tax=Elsinoe australis TaxID=40998 RepID=A0A4U7B4Z4_9PEZI|nr:hypothetical protein C1H76_3774 [Elsinoe australis]